MKHRTLLLLFILLGLRMFSQENQAYSFSLQQAIDFALENNRNAKNANLDIEAAKKQKWETTASGLPQINAAIDYQNWIKQQVQLLPAAAFDNTQNTIDIVNDYFDVTQDNFDVNTPVGFIPLQFGTKQNVNATATLTQLLFDGSYLVGLQSAKVYLQISKNAKVKTDLEVRNSVINSYGNVLLSEEGLLIVQKNKEILEKNLEETRKIYENGLTEEESLEQLEITLSNLESDLNKLERLRDIAYQMFNISIGLGVNTDTTLTDSLETLTAENISLELLEADDNVEKTIDYQIAENEKVSKELLLKLEKSKYLPTLNAFINGGYSGFSDKFTFANNNQSWFGSSLVGVSLNIPIFSSFMRSASTQRARINLEKAEIQLTDIEEQLRLQIATAKTEYQYAIEDYDNKKKNLNLAERIEKKNEVKFFEGIATSFDFRQAQTQLYTAQQEYLQAMLDVITTKAELETILNTPNINQQ